MAKKPTLHPYADKQAFDRLMCLIATLVQYPGVGGAEDDPPREGYRDALQPVQQQLHKVAAEMEISFPEGYPATPTLRKDLETLRRYGILDRRMYRHGYYLGTGAMQLSELQVALGALASVAKNQGNPQARRIHETLVKRLRGLDLERKGEFFYPVRELLNRAIVYTDPEEMQMRGKNQNTLFHSLEVVEQAILQGQVLEVSRHSDPYNMGRTGPIRIWPLQLVYHDIAWYLIYESFDNGLLAVGRLNRFSSYCKVLSLEGRGVGLQLESLRRAHKLLANGWGLFLGELKEQQAELQGQLPFETVKVRFFPPATEFILEGNRRHERQKVLPKYEAGSSKPVWVDYEVVLPPRSLSEFMRWVYKYLDLAQMVYPSQLVKQHQVAAEALIERYGSGLTR